VTSQATRRAQSAQSEAGGGERLCGAGRAAACAAAIVVLVTLAASPRTSAGASPGAQATPTPDVPAGWKRIPATPLGSSYAPFSVAVPEHWTYQPLMGIDSFVGEFTGDGVELTFDYGWWSNPLPSAGEPGYDVSFERISCAQAKLVVARAAPASVTGVYFEDTGTSGRMVGSERFRNKLQVSGRELDVEAQRTALAIFRSIRFDAACLSGRGGDWSVYDAPEGVLPRDVALADAFDGWAVGEGPALSAGTPSGCAVLRLRGTSAGQEGRCPDGGPLVALDLVADGIGWAVGGDRVVELTPDGWRLDYLAPSGTALRDVAAVDAEDALAIGSGGLLVRARGGWTPPDQAVRGHAISMRSATDGVVGDEHRLAALRGGTWTALDWFEQPPVSGMTLAAVAALPDDRVVVAGSDSTTGTLVDRRAGEGPIVTRFDGIGPLTAMAAVPEDGDAPAKVWLAGTDAAHGRPVLLYGEPGTQGGWERIEASFQGAIVAFDFADADVGWAVGWRAALPERDGTSVQRVGILLRYQRYAAPASSETPDPTTAGPGATASATPTREDTATATAGVSTPTTTPMTAPQRIFVPSAQR